jgi:hypothetical protein
MKLLITTLTMIFISFGANSTQFVDTCYKVKKTIAEIHYYYTDKDNRFVDRNTGPRGYIYSYGELIELYSNIYKNLNCK